MYNNIKVVIAVNYEVSENIIRKLKEKNMIFSKAVINEVDEILNIYTERMKWFQEHEIKQWRKYLDHHPREEFEDVIKNGYFFTLKQNNKIIACFELSTNSKFWNDEYTSAYYIYKIVTKVGCKAVGNLMFEICKDIAKTNHKKYLRLDCLQSNKKLNDIYNNHGFKLIKNGYENKNYYYGFSLRELEVDE